MTPQTIIVAVLILGFSLIVFGVAVGSAIGDGIVASKAVESIARQPEARGNIFTFFFLGVGILEAFPIIALVLGFYLFFVVANVPTLVGDAAQVSRPLRRIQQMLLRLTGRCSSSSSTSSSSW